MVSKVVSSGLQLDQNISHVSKIFIVDRFAYQPQEEETGNSSSEFDQWEALFSQFSLPVGDHPEKRQQHVDVEYNRK